MGTTYQIKIAGAVSDDKTIGRLKQQIDSALVQVNRQMSTYDPHSEISRFNDYRQTEPFPVSKDLALVVSEAIEISRLSGGAFDITIDPLVELWGFGKKGPRISPPQKEQITGALKISGMKNISVIEHKALKKKIPECRLDLAAIAKGYGVDVVSALLASSGASNYMVEIGGEVYAEGLNTQQDMWKIGVDSPDLSSLPGQNIRAILAISGVGVATSGDYRNYFEYQGKIYSHTIDPATGKPVNHSLASVTVIAPTCMKADALATAVMVMGTEKGLQLIESMEDVEAMLINRKKPDEYQIRYSSGFEKYLYSGSVE
jgi:thiamine biosynthesis lipoprotein